MEFSKSEDVEAGDLSRNLHSIKPDDCMMGKRWESMQQDILDLIVQRLSPKDLFTFSSVCLSWQSVATKQMSNSSPWLMLSGADSCDFFDPSKDTIHKVLLPEVIGRKRLSSGGWILTVGQDGNVSMLNPFFRNRIIKLPSLNRFSPSLVKEERSIGLYQNCTFNFALSASPLSKNYSVVVVYYFADEFPAKEYCFKGQPCLWRPGDKSWTLLEPTDVSKREVIYYKGRFLTLDIKGNIIAYDVDGPYPLEAKVACRMPQGLRFKRTILDCPTNMYLAELGGCVMVVVRATHWTFHVFEVDINGGNEWREADSLGDASIFVGYAGSCFAISVKDGRPCSVKPNCIYFTAEFDNSYTQSRVCGGKDVGVYHMEDRRIERIFHGDLFDVFCCPPLWWNPALF